MRYRNTLVPVNREPPSEDLVAFIAGSCGRWQICIIVVAFTSELIHGLNLYTKSFTLSQDLNFTCANGNGSQCFNANGSKCEKFIFFKDNNLITFAEKYLLICDKKESIIWTESCFRIGLIISYFIIGWTADRCGRKIAAMTYIPLHCISGCLLLIKSKYEMLLFLHVVHGVFSTSLNLLPQITLCDGVGSKWRTFALGFISYPLPISWMLSSYFSTIFNDVNEIIIVVSLLPIIILIPLLSFRDSPNYFLLKADFVRAEEVLRKIAHFNRCPISVDTKIRPVEVIDKKASKQSYGTFWNSKSTRNPFLALLCLWFFEGITYNILVSVVNNDGLKISHSIIFGITSLLGCIVAVILCHLMPHKIVICIFSLLKNVFIFVLVLSTRPDVLHREISSNAIFVLKMSSFCIYRVASTTLENLTPRMFPTGFRSQGVGVCLSIFHVGGVLTSFVLSSSVYTNDALWITTTLMLMIFFPAFETASCFWIWKVHRRELPDYIEDCVNFKKFYKPLRYLGIQEQQTLYEDEVEVKLMDLESEK